MYIKMEMSEMREKFNEVIIALILLVISAIATKRIRRVKLSRERCEIIKK